MKHFYLIIIFSLIFSLKIFAQEGTIKIAKPKTTEDKAIEKPIVPHKNKILVAPLAGFLWQGYNNLEIGIKPTYWLGRQHDNISLSLGCDLFKHHVTYCSPFATLKYYDQFKKEERLAWMIAFNYSLTRVNGVIDQRISPELGFGIPIISISYGYNISITKEYIPFLLPHRVVVRVSIF